MRFDFSSVDDVDSFVSVPEGVHRCRVAEVREGRARDGSVRWSFRLEVLDGDYAGRTAAWDSITWSERGVYRVKKLLEAFGMDVRGEVEVQSSDLVGLRALVKVEPEEREDPLTGRRQVRMRVPYLGYAALPAEEREAHARNGAAHSDTNGAVERRTSRGLDGEDDESLAPVDGWGARREALPRHGSQAHETDERAEGDEFGF